MKPCSHYRGKTNIHNFFPECKDLVKLLHGVSGYQFLKLIPVLMPIHHFGSSPQSWPLWLSNKVLAFYTWCSWKMTKSHIDLNNKHGPDTVSTGTNHLCLVTSPSRQTSFANLASAIKNKTQKNQRTPW